MSGALGLQQQAGGVGANGPRTQIRDEELTAHDHVFNVNSNSSEIRTTTGDSSSEEKLSTKKRKSTYSRKGCLQCKKAHTKCDERKPKCSRCEKRSIDCTYRNQFVFQKNEFPNVGSMNYNSAIMSSSNTNNVSNNNNNGVSNTHSNHGVSMGSMSNNGHLPFTTALNNANQGSTVGLGVGSGGLSIPVAFSYPNGPIPLQLVGNTAVAGIGGGTSSSPTPGSAITSPIGGTSLGFNRTAAPHGSIAYASLKGSIPAAAPYHHQQPNNSGSAGAVSTTSGIRSLPPLTVDSTQNMINYTNQQDDSTNQLDVDSNTKAKQESNAASSLLLQQQQQQQEQHARQAQQSSQQQFQSQNLNFASTPLTHVYPMTQSFGSTGSLAGTESSNTLSQIKRFAPDVQNNFITDTGFDQKKLYQSVKESLANTVRKRTTENMNSSDNLSHNNVISRNNSNNNNNNNNTNNDAYTQFNSGHTQTGSGTLAGGEQTEMVPDTDDTNFDADLVNIRDYIYISPTDWNFLNLLRFDQNQTRNTTPELAQSSQTNLFKLCWRGASNSEIFSVFSTYDPIQLLYATENPSAATTIPLDDPKLLNFIWTVSRVTLLGGNLILFPFENHFDPLLNDFITMGRKDPVMKDVLIYVTALFMKDAYYNSNLKYFSHIWDRYVRMPTLKRCLDQLTSLIRKSNDYCGNISLTFTVTVLFAANSSIKSSDWRTHLRGVHDLFMRVEKLKPAEINQDNIEELAHDCYLFVKDWFCHAEVLAWITSDKGGCFDKQEDLEDLLNNATYSKFNLLNSRMDLLRGYTTDYYPIFTKLSSFLLNLKKRGKDCSGTNMLRSYFTESDPAVIKSFKDMGDSTLKMLENIRIDDEYIDQATTGLCDIRLRLSMKNCTRMYHYALNLYLELFFLGKPLDKIGLKTKLEKMLECLFSIPFQNTCSIACHWPIYLGAIGSLMIEDKNLYSHFTSVLDSFVSNGMNVASNSLERLAHISKALSYGDYSALVDPAHDYIVY